MCWGDGLHGKLGRTLEPEEDDLLSNYLRDPQPTEVDGLSLVLGIALGGEHACALTGSELSCWGRNDQGQLGDETTEDRVNPARVVW